MMTSCETKKQGKTNGEVTVVIMAKKATNIELRLTYRMLLSTLSMRSFSLNLPAPCQLSETQRGLLRTSYTPPRKLAFPRHRYPCTIVPGSHKVQAKIGRTSASHSAPLTWTYPTRLSPSSVLRRSDPQASSVTGPCRYNNSNNNSKPHSTNTGQSGQVSKRNPVSVAFQVAYLAQRPSKRCHRHRHRQYLRLSPVGACATSLTQHPLKNG
jgi:hypothetical protein